MTAQFASRVLITGAGEIGGTLRAGLCAFPVGFGTCSLFFTGKTVLKYRVRWLALMLCVAATPAAGANFPERPLRIIVAFSSGTAADIVARQMAIKLSESMGKQVIVENRDGAAGTIGTATAVHATADGYTMLIASPSIVISPLLIKNLTYDVFRDLAPVGLLANFPTVLIVGAQSKAHTALELIELARANPGKLATRLPAGVQRAT